nr:shikimate kinase [Pseudomarimonas arenosa]
MALRVVAKYGLGHLDLDRLVWEPGKIAVPRPEDAIATDLQRFIEQHCGWVIEGCYAEWIGAALPHCSALWFLNPGLESCLSHNLQRPWEPHKYPSLEAQNRMLSTLQDWVRGYYTRADAWSLAAHRRLYDAYDGPKHEFLRVVDYPG